MDRGGAVAAGLPLELRARIESGELPPGARVPSITTLMQEYGIARTPPGTPWRS